jgi:ribosome-associated heat shock protein Hsp15
LRSFAISTLAPERDATAAASLRLDKWLWFARFFKSRSLASAFCQDGRIRISGHIVEKAHQLVRPGDVLTFARGENVRVIKVVALAARRGPAAAARELYEDLAPLVRRNPDTTSGSLAKRAQGAGRPTKLDRRAIAKLTGR